MKLGGSRRIWDLCAERKVISTDKHVGFMRANWKFHQPTWRFHKWWCLYWWHVCFHDCHDCDIAMYNPQQGLLCAGTVQDDRRSIHSQLARLEDRGPGIVLVADDNRLHRQVRALSQRLNHYDITMLPVHKMLCFKTLWDHYRLSLFNSQV